MEKEYQIFRSALDASSDAFIIFDEQRKIFFVSQHYYDAYPESTPELVCGLGVEDTFLLLSKEDNIMPEEQRYQDIRKFWHELGDGEIEFSLGDGRRWAVKSAKLPDNQGTIVTTTDITIMFPAFAY